MPTLLDINQDLTRFEKLIDDLKTNNPETYDSSLKIPVWRATGEEDYANFVKSETARFATHLHFLETPDNPILSDESTNKNLIRAASQNLLGFVTLYENNVSHTELSKTLMQNLKDIHSILKDYKRPDTTPDATPPRPTNR